jgi:hypothetical protein
MTTPDPVTSCGAALAHGLPASGPRKVLNTLTTAFSMFGAIAGAAAGAAGAATAAGAAVATPWAWAARPAVARTMAAVKRNMGMVLFRLKALERRAVTQ